MCALGSVPDGVVQDAACVAIDVASSAPWGSDGAEPRSRFDRLASMSAKNTTPELPGANAASLTRLISCTSKRPVPGLRLVSPEGPKIAWFGNGTLFGRGHELLRRLFAKVIKQQCIDLGEFKAGDQHVPPLPTPHDLR